MSKLPEGVTRNEDGDLLTSDGFRLSLVQGGRYVIEAPAGYVDDLGDPIRRYEIPGRDRALAFIDTIRRWNSSTKGVIE